MTFSKFLVDACRVLCTVYVALGDSFAAGVGAGKLSDRTCYRSAEAWPVLLAKKLQLSLLFPACTGAVTHGTKNNVDPMQLGSLSDSTKLVTLSIGGELLYTCF
jgi:lysophospholipase L1-like esterase